MKPRTRLPLFFLALIVPLTPICCLGQESGVQDAVVQPAALPIAADPIAPVDPIAPAISSSADYPKPPGRIFWLIPNFRTSRETDSYESLTTSQKFHIAQQDTFDRGTFALAAVFAGEGMLTRSNRSYGQGVEGYSKYLGASYADLAIGNYFTEAIFPTMLHQDPRYFRRGHGHTMSRLGYAVGQIFITHSDSGAREFNYSELGGNAAAIAVSTAYDPSARSASEALSKLGTQILLDMASNIAKEFWPDRRDRER